jgi:putative redox protein
MTATAPRRIQRLAVKISVPQSVSPEHRQRLENAAHSCPVHRSLHPDVEKPIEFVWA